MAAVAGVWASVMRWLLLAGVSVALLVWAGIQFFGSLGWQE